MLSIEQNAMLQFKLHSAPIKEAINDTKLEPLIAVNDALIDAVSWFGVAEHFARKADRFSFVKDNAGTKQSQSVLKRHNETGLEILSRANLHLDKLSVDFGKGLPSGKDKDIKTVVARCVADFKATVSDFDIKPGDVEKLLKAIDEVDRAFTKAGHDGVIKLAQKKVKELQNLRSRPDRGAVENLPVWKVVAIVAAIAIWLTGAIHCGFFGCSLAAGFAYFSAFAIAAFVAYFC